MASLRRRRDERGRVPRGRQLRRRDGRAARPLLQQQPVGDLDAARGADARGGARRQGRRLRDPRCARRRRSTCSPCTRRRARRSSARAPAAGRRSSRRVTTAPRRTRPPTTRAPTSTSSASRRSERTNASAATSALPPPAAGVLTDERAEPCAPRRRGADARAGSPRRRPSRRPTRSSCSHTRTSTRRRTSAMAELTLVEAVNDALHTELARDDDVMVMGEDVGRAGGVFRATAGLRDRFGAIAASTRRSPRRGSSAAPSASAWRAGGRSCEMQYDAFSYPCLDQLITHVGRYRWRTRRRDGVPAHDAHAVRRRRSRARAARRLARGVLRAHARDQGRDPVDARRREGTARRGDPRSRIRSSCSSRSSSTARRAARCPRRARRPARRGADRARGHAT